MRKKLSDRQQEIMEIFWQQKRALIASEILTLGKDLNINTVQASIRSLVKKGYLVMDNIVYSGTVLTRSYKPLVSKEEYLQDGCKELLDLSDGGALLAALIDQEEDEETLKELENLIRRKRKELEG